MPKVIVLAKIHDKISRIHFSYYVWIELSIVSLVMEEDNDKKYFHVERGVQMCQFLGLACGQILCLGLDIESFIFV